MWLSGEELPGGMCNKGKGLRWGGPGMLGGSSWRTEGMRVQGGEARDLGVCRRTAAQ